MRLLVAAAVAALAVACTPANKTTAITPELVAKTSAELTAYLDAEYEEELAMSPIQLTMQGRKEQYDKIDEMTDAAIDKKLAWRNESVAEMKAKFDPAKLDEESRTSFDTWALQLDMDTKAAQFRRQPYVFIKDGPHVFLPNFLINFHEVSEKSHMEAYVARLGAMAVALDQSLENARLAAAAGDRPPRFAFDQAIAESKNVITGAPFGRGKDSPLFADAKAKIKALQDGGKLNADEAKALQEATSKALTEQVKPAYDRIIAWLEADKANTPVEARGASTLTSGTDYYNAQLEIQTTTSMTADEIHQLGLNEVARIRGEMEKLKDQVGFKGDLPAFFQFIRTSKQFILPDTAAGRAAYIKLAEDYLGGMKKKLPEYFGILPKADLVVKRVEAFREEPGGAQHYFPGTPDGSRPGIFYAHLSDMKAMPTYDLESTAYHEGLPGHHMQLSIAQELKDIPKFRTQYGYTAYQEGWGLYSESLAKEMGFYTDPYPDFGRLSNEMWRAVRLVVDTGIHSKGWTEEQAVKFFMDNAPTAETAIRSEVRRYFVWPGQATCYKIGELKIRELRDLAKAELGDKFDYRAFHDVVLGGGALPLPVLEGRVKRWIEKVKTPVAAG